MGFLDRATIGRVTERLIDEAAAAKPGLARLAVGGVPAQPQLKRLRRAEPGAPVRRSLPGMERMLQRAAGLQAAVPVPLEDHEWAAMAAQGVADWLASPSVPADVDPLAWWAAEAAKESRPVSITVLTTLARKYLCIPGANGSVERVWSSGRRILTFNRQSLAGSRVSQLLSLKHNAALSGQWPPKPMCL